MKKKCEVPCEEVKKAIEFINGIRIALCVLLVGLVIGLVGMGVHRIYADIVNSYHIEGQDYARWAVRQCWYSERVTDEQRTELNKIKDDSMRKMHYSLMELSNYRECTLNIKTRNLSDN